MKDQVKKILDNQIAFYQSSDGSVNIEVLFAEENIWLTQKKMAELFDTTPQNITQHLKNIYAEGEVNEAVTCKDFLQVQDEGWRMRLPRGETKRSGPPRFRLSKERFSRSTIRPAPFRFPPSSRSAN